MTTNRTLDADYSTARHRFIESARNADARLDTFVHPQRGIEGEELAVDVAQRGDEDAPSVLVIVSATHGVEGYAGSALQSWWLDERVDQRPDDLRVVMIHGFNPYGFSWVRRVNEDNVDLNRNFVDWDAPPNNVEYSELAELLVPTTWSDESQTATSGALMEHAGNVGLERFQQMVTGGQYAHADGIFYGGAGAVWSHRWLDDHLDGLVASAERCGVIDIHTGLGDWGYGELICHEPHDHPSYQRGTTWWGDVRSMREGESVSASLDGDWLATLDDRLPNREVTAVALEYGTVDPISVLQALRADAWLHGHGDATGPESAAIRAQVRAAFADDDPSWLEAIIERFDSVATGAMQGLSGSPGR